MPPAASSVVVSTRAPRYGRAFDARLNMRPSLRVASALLLVRWRGFQFQRVVVAQSLRSLGDEQEIAEWDRSSLLRVQEAEDLHEMLLSIADAQHGVQLAGLAG